MATLPQLNNIEYRSKEEINGWPMIDVNFGTNPETGRPKVAKGVVAVGNIAFGVVSIGAAAFGIVTMAGVGLGVVSLASIAIGIVALGAAALGYAFALGAVVQSAEIAIGALVLDSHFVAWSLIIAASGALVIRVLRMVKAIDCKADRINLVNNQPISG